MIKTQIFICSLIIFTHVQSQPLTAKELYEKGMKKNQSFHYIDASVFFTQAIALESKFPKAYYQRGLSFEGMGKVFYAIKDYNKSINQGIKNVDAYLKLISHYKNTGQYDSAILICQKLIQVMPENAAGAYFDLGKIYEKMNNDERAIKSYEKSIDHLDEKFVDFKNQLLSKIKSLQE